MYSIDWAVRKELRVFDIKKEKLKTISSTVPEFAKFLTSIKDPTNFYFEEGGGDSFKLLARRKGHQVYTILGKKTKEHRDNLGVEKSDEADAVIIGLIAKSQPEEFYQFRELDDITARISILFKERADTEESLVRQKNKLFALKGRLELIDLDGYKEKVIKRKENIIDALEKEFRLQSKLLGKEVEKHHVWSNYLKDIKGVGAVVGAGLIARIKRASRFTDKYSLRHFAGMIAKKGNQQFDHKLKKTLYHFTEGIIKQRTPIWRELYDNMKEFYKDKHPDWSKAKVNNFAKKFVQTKFLDSVFENMIKIEKDAEDTLL